MPNIMDLVTSEVTRMVGSALQEMKEFTWQGGKDVMLRRLRQSYDKLTLEQLDAIRGVMGHTDTEANPCEVCRIMARKELELAED